MKLATLLLVVLVSLNLHAKKRSCSYGVTLKQLSFAKYFESEKANQQWQEGVEVIIENNYRDDLSYGQDLSWVHELWNEVDYQSAYNFDFKSYLRVYPEGKRINFLIYVSEGDVGIEKPALSRAVSIRLKDLELVWTDKVIKENGVYLKYRIKKSCR